MAVVISDVQTALAGWRSASDRDRLLQVVQPGLIGLIDGTISTLAPIFASAYVAGSRAALLVGLAAALGAAIVAAAVLTGGFGLLGDDGGGGKASGKGTDREKKIEVAVLNATQEEDTVTGEPIAGVEGLAGKVADEVVKPAGYKTVAETDAASGLNQTVVMFDDSAGAEEAEANEDEAMRLAEAVAGKLGETNVVPMIPDVRERSEGAPLALVVGADDADF